MFKIHPLSLFLRDRLTAFGNPRALKEKRKIEGMRLHLRCEKVILRNPFETFQSQNANLS